MSHQQSSFFDNEPNGSNNKFNDKFLLVDLLVKKKISNLALKTSNPKRVQNIVENYMGIQVYHQRMLGKMWLMSQFLKKNIFPQETQILAWKVVFNER